MLTAQEIFDKAAKGVIAQGVPAYVGHCAYLIKTAGEPNLMCGVGHLLADDEMRTKWDRKTWTMAFVQSQANSPDKHYEEITADLERCGISRGQVPLLNEIQNAHDDASHENYFIASFTHKMKQIAEAYDLNTDALA